MIKNIIKVLLAVFVFSFFISGCNLDETKIDNNIENRDNNIYLSSHLDLTIGKIGDNMPITRGEVAKMISFIYFDKNEIEALDRIINFKDTNIDKWYDKYINAAVTKNMISGVGDGSNFDPEGYLTLNQAQLLIDRIDPNNKLKIKLTDETKDKPISFALWSDLFIKVLTNMSEQNSIFDTYNIKENSFIVLATYKNTPKLKEGYIITDKGLIECESLDLSVYINTEISVLQKDNEIISVIELKNITPTIYNSYVTNADNDGITIFSGGIERKYYYKNNEDIEKENFNNIYSNDNAKGNIADITIDGDFVLDLKITDNKINEQTKAIDYNFAELSKTGIINMDNNFKIYSVNEKNVKCKDISDIIVGTSIADYFIKDNKICAAVINQPAELSSIRVGINTTGFKSLIHESVLVTSDTNYTVAIGEETKEFKAGEVLEVSKTSNKDLFNQQRIYINSDREDGKLILKSIQRNWKDNKSPEYRGGLEIAKNGEGYTIVNEVNIEQYLYGVVPSEMPVSFGEEASKVQAITARSYAYNQYYSNRFHKYGANIDDSVNSQVYNNMEENSVSNKAVDETKGKCITFNGNVVNTNFFSTSAGVTANSGEIWPNGETKEYPYNTPEYLKSKLLKNDKDYGDLSKEENADKFLKDLDISSFDDTAPMYRWNFSMTSDEISACINANLKKLYEANPYYIKTLQKDGSYISQNIENIGKVKDIEILKRGAGGNVMEMKITGENAVIIVSTENNIRKIIHPKQYLNGKESIVLTKKDGSVLHNMESMPSTFFVIDKIYDENKNLASVNIHGGGYGHGVGMSQYAVKGMSEEGYKAEEIIKFFYGNTEIKEIIK